MEVRQYAKEKNRELDVFSGCTQLIRVQDSHIGIDSSRSVFQAAKSPFTKGSLIPQSVYQVVFLR